MRKFKTVEELEQQRKEALGLIPFKMPIHLLLLVYARQSTKGQVLKNRESALAQTEEQLERATELGWSEDKRILLIENQAKDGKIRNASGRLRIDEREGLSTVMYYINNGEAGAAMARDVARFFRDEDLIGPVVFAKACKEHHVLVITDDYIYNFNDPIRGKDDYKRFIAEAQAAADFLEKHVKGVMHKHKERKAQRGEYVGGAVPVGFMLDDDRAFYVPNPCHIEPVKALFKRFRALGGNLNDLRREIFGKPIFPDLPPEIVERIGNITLTKVPGGWTIKTRPGLAYILTNPTYIGHVHRKGRIVKRNAHPAIVDEDDFWYAYYRLASTDFEGNPIEHPEGVTKRYQQAKTISYETLLMGLRHDGTPVLTTNMSARAGAYTYRDGNRVHYAIEDYSQMSLTSKCAKISATKLDNIFSERLHYRVGEALKDSGEYPLDEEEAEQLESRRGKIHSQLLTTLEEVKEPENGKPDPLDTLRSSIAETKIKITEKERISEFGTDSMHSTDLQRHFESLKKLRLSLAAMEQKLNKAGAEEQEREEAMEKLPEVYERWDGMKMEDKRRFIRVATSRVMLDEIRDGWLKLTIEWSPVLGGNLIDEAYIWILKGAHGAWAEEEERVLRENYATSSRSWLMEQLPERSWMAIRARAKQWDLYRPYRPKRAYGTPSPLISVSDWQLMQELELPLDELLENRVTWKEYVGLSLIENEDRRQRHSSLR